MKGIWKSIMKEIYETPKIEVITFNTEDLLLMSGLGDGGETDVEDGFEDLG